MKFWLTVARLYDVKPWTSAPGPAPGPLPLGLPTRLANTIIMCNSLRHYTPSLDEVSLCAQNVIVKNTE